MTARIPISPVAGTPSLLDQVYNHLLEAICDCRLEPGTVLRQEELARNLGVSRQPVQQALQLLRRQRLVHEHGRSGVQVAPVEAGFVRQLYEVRGALDACAARLAAGRPCSAGDVATGRRLIDQGRAALRSGVLTDRLAADVRFHSFIYELSGNPLLDEAAASYWHHIRRLIALTLRTEHPMHAVWDDHAAILQAIVDGEPGRAEQLAIEHARNNARLLLARLEGG
ncbi:GntR family transcriptional regulator [Thalassobaculum sp.]|uniref:GntR family transcriptional regulator n=1 Tax=Thalassobaculum sp. TaxID=2022740 RepID=UPI003B5CED36